MKKQLKEINEIVNGIKRTRYRVTLSSSIENRVDFMFNDKSKAETFFKSI